MEENKEIVSVDESALGRIVITEAQVALIKNTVAIGATNDELKLFFYECRRRGVHPLDRMIHFVKRGKEDKARATFQAGIDFLRSQAEETGEYRGQEKPEFGPLKKDTQYPEWATITVRRKDPDSGEVYLVSAIAYWDEYYPGELLGFMWRKMPRSQLAKCAEALALRKAFPKKIAGLYSFEEMEQADIIEGSEKAPLQEPKKKNGEQPKKETETIITGVDHVTQKDGIGANKKPFARYTVHVGEIKYGTFSKTVAEDAKRASQGALNVTIEYKKTEYGPEIVSLVVQEPPEDDSAQT